MNKILITLLVLAPLPVFAQSADGQRGPKMFESRDKNGDGKLSPEELPNERVFKMLDKDGDGFVTKAEAKSMRGGGAGAPDKQRMKRAVDATMKRMDTNMDGKIGADELPRAGRLTMKADRNKDGFIDAKELARAMAAGGRGGRSGDPIQRLMQMDANKDGAIQKEEWKARPEMFDRLDKNKDGELTKAELESLAKDMRRRGGWKNRASNALFRRMDTNKDKRISPDEWTMNADHFAKFDANGDGFITPDEVMPKGGRRQRQRYDIGSGKDSAAFLTKYDKNRDGSIDKKEFPHGRRFAEIDADGNGLLSKEEVEQSLDKARSERSYDFIERFDLNRDGKVTREEFTGPARIFESKDKNFDGVVDQSDLPKSKNK